MKKLLLLVAVFTAFSFASCKKDHTCTCTESYSDGSPGSTMVYTITNAKKGDAKKACISSTSVDGSVTTTSTCTLK